MFGLWNRSWSGEGAADEGEEEDDGAHCTANGAEI